MTDAKKINKALIEKNEQLSKAVHKLQSERKSLEKECGALKSSLKDKTLLLAVDYDKLSAAFSVLKKDYQNLKKEYDTISINIENQVKIQKVELETHYEIINKLDEEIDIKEWTLRWLEMFNQNEQNKKQEIEEKITQCYNKKEMIENEIKQLENLKSQYNNIDKDVKSIQQLKEQLLKEVEDISAIIVIKEKELKTVEKKIEDINNKEQELIERDWFLSERESWINAKRDKLKKAKLELEQFYERKLNHINLD